MARIIILGSAHPLRGGGMATFNERLAREFTDAGHQVTIFTFSLQYPAFLFPGKTQYSDEPAPADLDIRVRVNSINPLNWRKVGREIRSMRPDVLVVRYWLPLMAPCLATIASVARKNRHTRVVAITDNVTPHERRPGDRLLTRYFLRRMDGFVSMSDAVTNDLLLYGVRPQAIRYCPHPLYDNFGTPVEKEQARTKLRFGHGDNLLLFFGFIRKYKGLDLLLEALSDKALCRLGVKLVVAGEFYSDPHHYHELAKRLGVEDRVLWHTRFIPSEEVKYYFCAADLVVQPYRQATQSGVTQIAYHFDKPMVVSRTGGLPEMVPHGRAGYVVDVRPDAISKAVHDFFDNRRSDAFVSAVREEKKRFSWDRMVEALLHQALSEK